MNYAWINNQLLIFRYLNELSGYKGEQVYIYLSHSGYLGRSNDIPNSIQDWVPLKPEELPPEFRTYLLIEGISV